MLFCSEPIGTLGGGNHFIELAWAEGSLLEEDDVLLVEPGVGHASFAQQPNTRAPMLHLSTSAFRPYVKKGFALHFPEGGGPDSGWSGTERRMIRFCAAQVYRAASEDGPFARLAAKAGMEQLMAVLCARSSPREARALSRRSTGPCWPMGPS